MIETLADAERFLVDRVAAQQQAAAAIEGARADSVRACLFDKELALADDTRRFITACCGRRAGKTYTVAAMMLRAARKHAGRTVLYLTLTRDGAKGIIWPTLKQLNEQFGLGGVPNESDLTMTMPGGAVIALRGVDKRKEIEKRRGFGFALVVIDECQSIPEYVRGLVDEVIGPALADVPGRLIMIGTPSLLASGYWYECHHNPDSVWGHYAWTMWENPHIPSPDETFAQELARRGVKADDVSVQREWRGRWLRDVSSAVFAFDPKSNIFGALPSLKAGLWSYIIAVDIGGGVNRDRDAVVVLACHAQHRATYLVEEHVDAKQDVTELAQKVGGIRDRLGPDNVIGIVADTGGIGAKVAEEMRRRYGLDVRAAKKSDKWANIELLNAACRHGEFFALEGSEFAAECVKVEKDWDKTTPDRIVIKGHMPDVCDATLYGFVESQGWLAELPPVPPPPRGTPEWAAQESAAMERAELEEYEERKQANEEAGWDGWTS